MGGFLDHLDSTMDIWESSVVAVHLWKLTLFLMSLRAPASMRMVAQAVSPQYAAL